MINRSCLRKTVFYSPVVYFRGSSGGTSNADFLFFFESSPHFFQKDQMSFSTMMIFFFSDWKSHPSLLLRSLVFDTKVRYWFFLAGTKEKNLDFPRRYLFLVNAEVNFFRMNTNWASILLNTYVLFNFLNTELQFNNSRATIMYSYDEYVGKLNKIIYIHI